MGDRQLARSSGLQADAADQLIEAGIRDRIVVGIQDRTSPVERRHTAVGRLRDQRIGRGRRLHHGVALALRDDLARPILVQIRHGDPRKPQGHPRLERHAKQRLGASGHRRENGLSQNVTLEVNPHVFRMIEPGAGDLQHRCPRLVDELHRGDAGTVRRGGGIGQHQGRLVDAGQDRDVRVGNHLRVADRGNPRHFKIVLAAG